MRSHYRTRLCDFVVLSKGKNILADRWLRPCTWLGLIANAAFQINSGVVIPLVIFVCCVCFASPKAPAQTETAVLAESFSLEQAYDRVLETDQTIRIAYEEVRKNNLLTWSALARLGPRVTGSANYSKPEYDISAGLGPVLVDTKRADITVEQPLIDFTVLPALRFVKLTQDSTRLLHQSTVRNVLFGVTQAYYNVLRHQRVLDINRLTLELARQQLDLAEKRFKVGEVTQSDVLRARVAVERAKRAVTESENALRLARNVLNSILNFDSERSLILIEPPEHAVEVEPLEKLLHRANERREDLRVSELAIQQAIQRRNEVLCRYAPKVSAIWNNQWLEPETFAAKTDFWQAGITVRMTFFEGGQREVDLQTAERQIEQARLNHRNLAKSVEVDVREALLRVQTLEQTLKTVRAEVQAAEENHKNLQTQYRAGTATSLDVLDALRELNTARTELAVRTYEYQVALRNLERATGVFQEERVRKVKAR